MPSGSARSGRGTPPALSDRPALRPIDGPQQPQTDHLSRAQRPRADHLSRVLQPQNNHIGNIPLTWRYKRDCRYRRTCLQQPRGQQRTTLLIWRNILLTWRYERDCRYRRTCLQQPRGQQRTTLLIWRNIPLMWRYERTCLQQPRRQLERGGPMLGGLCWLGGGHEEVVHPLRKLVRRYPPAAHRIRPSQRRD